MQWPERIESNPEVMVGKPVIKGTRITVERSLELLAAGADEAYRVKDFPRLKKEDIQACLQLNRV